MEDLKIEQILVRVPTRIKIIIEEIAKDEQVSQPEWIREAIVQRIENEYGIKIAG